MTGKLLASLILAGVTVSAFVAGIALDAGGGFLITAAVLALLSGHLATGHLAVAERVGSKRKTTQGKGLSIANLALGYVLLLCWLVTTFMISAKPPEVTIERLGKEIRRPSGHDLTVRFKATAENGVKSAKLVAMVDNEVVDEIEVDVPADEYNVNELELEGYLPLHKFKAGDIVSYYVQVDDGEKEGQSDTFQVTIVDESEYAMLDRDTNTRKDASGGERAKTGEVGGGETGDTKGGLNEENENAGLEERHKRKDDLVGAPNGVADRTNTSGNPLEGQLEDGKAVDGDNLDEGIENSETSRQGEEDFDNIDLAANGNVISPTVTRFSIDTRTFETTEEEDVDQPFARDTTTQRAVSMINSLGVSVPKSMAGRCDVKGRLNRVAEAGGTRQVEETVQRGLHWLKVTQNPDGSWGDRRLGAMTGFALLCFLGHCDLTDSKEYGVTVDKAIKWLVKKGTDQGGWLFHQKDKAGAYSHGIATYALAEAYGMTEDESIAPVLGNALAWIVDGQKEDGGWFYLKRGDSPSGWVFDRNKNEGSDTSVSGWQFQALKAAYNCGKDFPGVKESLTESVRNFYRVYSSANGGFGYRKRSDSKGQSHKLTGVGAIGLQGWKYGHLGDDKRYPGGTLKEGDRDAIIRKACDHISKRSRFVYNGSGANLYAWYYETQAMFNKGGRYWESWRPKMQKELFAAQNKDGSWKKEGPNGKPLSNRAGSELDSRIYRSALCLLMLEVYYRYVY